MNGLKLPEEFTPEFEGLAEALTDGEPTVSVRFNAARAVQIPDDMERVPWCQQGIYLESRPQFTFDPALHQGVYYVQDASSMIHSHIVAQLTAERGPLLCLDACAAPGGKTTAALDALPQGSFVLANEYVAARAEALAQNLARWGSPMTAVSQGDTSRFRKLRDMFQLIVADVPCSGEGMFRKDAEAVRQWSPRLVAECAQLQREITANLWHALAPGGYMIYLTCTFNHAENQDIIDYMLTEFDGAEPVDIDVPDEWGIVRRGHCLHFLPGRIRGEGLTVAVLRKAGQPAQVKKNSDKNRLAPVAPTLADAARRWLKDNDDFVLRQYGDICYAQPRRWESAIGMFNKNLKMVNHGGLELAQMKGRDLLPLQPLALSQSLADNAFARHEVDYPTAIAYLQRQSLQLREDTPRGIVLLTYQGLPLGFVKNLGNRANNLYPASWRILSTYVPESAPSVFSKK